MDITSKTNYSCVLCMEETQLGPLSVGCDECKIYYCDDVDCIKSYLKICKDEYIIPKCHICKLPLHAANLLRHSDQNVSDLLLRAYKNYYLRRLPQGLKSNVEEEIIIEKLRREKIKFLEETLPQCLNFTMDKLYKNEIGRIDQKKVSRVREAVETNKKCFFSSCVGYLDSDYKCETCNKRFCKQCERLLSPNHECKEEDLASLKEIQSCQMCPSCSTPTFKDVGCDLMTCSNCGTHYHYKTRELITFGNNHNERISLKETTLLSERYEKELKEKNVLDIVLAFEKKVKNLKKKRETKKLGQLVTHLHKAKLVSNYIDASVVEEIALAHCSLEFVDLELRKYYRVFSDIETLIADGSLSEKEVKNMMKHLKFVHIEKK